MVKLPTVKKAKKTVQKYTKNRVMFGIRPLPRLDFKKYFKVLFKGFLHVIGLLLLIIFSLPIILALGLLLTPALGWVTYIVILALILYLSGVVLKKMFKGIPRDANPFWVGLNFDLLGSLLWWALPFGVGFLLWPYLVQWLLGWE